jgi:N-acetylneuraminate synthase
MAESMATTMASGQQAVEVKIGDRLVGEAHPPLVIAEVGINHEGDVNKALQCVDAAVAAGAECIKFQCHITEAEMIPTDMTPGDISSEKLWDIIERCELTADEERRVQNYCAEKDILYLSTPFSREAADRLQAMDVPAFKIGSGECNNLPLVDHIGRFGKPVILSTGMNDPQTIAPSVEILRSHSCPMVLMHCTSLYPTPFAKVRLQAISELRDLFGVPVGFSDHSPGIHCSVASVALGACVIEKHFTISREWPGPDNPISIEPDELASLVSHANDVFLARGGSKTVLSEEQPVIDFAFASVVTIRPVSAGEEFSADNLWVKRPGTGGFHAREYQKLIGRVASRDIPADTALAPGDIVNAEV